VAVAGAVEELYSSASRKHTPQEEQVGKATQWLLVVRMAVQQEGQTLVMGALVAAPVAQALGAQTGTVVVGAQAAQQAQQHPLAALDQSAFISAEIQT
jgi:hypothetical protein